MGDLSAAQDTISPLVAVLWVFYPMAALVLIELILRAINDDDDDQDGDGANAGIIFPPSLSSSSSSFVMARSINSINTKAAMG